MATDDEQRPRHGPVHMLDAGRYYAVVRDGAAVIERADGTGAVVAVEGQPQPEKVVVEFDLAGLWLLDGQTFGELVVERAARALLHEQAQAADELRRRARAITDEELRAAIRPLLAEAIDAAFQPTDAFGSSRGPKVTLREAISNQVKKEVTKRPDGGTMRRASILEEIVEAEVGRALRGELRKVVDAAKGEVIEAVRAQAADVIAETIRRTANL